MTDKPANILHLDTTIPQSTVDAALEALGIPREKFRVIHEVRIHPREVEIVVFETDDKGKYVARPTDLGNVASMGIRSYKIVKD